MVLMSQRCMYVCIHAYVGYIYKYQIDVLCMCHTNTYTLGRGIFSCTPASSLLKSEQKFLPQNDLFHVNGATSPCRPFA